MAPTRTGSSSGSRCPLLLDRLVFSFASSEVSFPANVPTGQYLVEVYLLREGRIVQAQTIPLIVSKIGVEAEIFDFAYDQSALYGLIAILVALVSGWLAHIAFRKA